MRTGDVEDVDLLLVGNIDDFEPRRGEESVAARRLAAHERRIEIVLRRAQLLKRARPRLRGNVIAARHAAETRTNFPVALLLRRRAEIDVAVGPARRWLGRSSRRGRRRATLRGRRCTQNPENPENPE